MNKSLNKAKNFDLLAFVLNNKAFLLMILMMFCSAIMTQGMSTTSYNIAGVMRQISVLAIISVGFTLILAGGNMDLSVSDIISLCGVAFALTSRILPLWLSIIITIFLGVVCEAFNGFMIRFFKLPGFVLTLATGQVYKGITHIVTDGKSVGGLSDAVKFIGQGTLFGFIPVPFVIMIVVAICMAILITRTIFGRHVLATGGNANAAKVSGINIDFVKVTSMMVAGSCFALGSIVLTGRVASASSTAGDSYLMDAIASVVIGGTPMHGGKAKVTGTLFGVALIGIINNMLNLLNISSFWQWVCKGFIIIVAIVLDASSDAIMMRTKK